MTLHPKNFVRPAAATVLLLLVPFVAMRFDTGVNWSASDFLIMGALIFATGFAYEFVSSQRGTVQYRLAVGVGLAAGFLGIWVNLAVGLVGSGPNLANLLFGLVPVVALVGAVAARLQQRGMAKAMLAAGAVQFLVPIVALLVWQAGLAPERMREIALNMGFVVLWLASAGLFWQANGRQQHANQTLPNGA
ncbi:hypothetical protein F0P96_01420 [Hymenobacter busanensis]|uniref:Uncharacterized protein n=1 Tax=Hymenobacter busanensis TaxID=2607656 RepID=A0A7L4ZVQ7_9BACT|nr:hypothetical protein [Hymenobacter busanensis]KAA9339313.1 hypothetical protein F0P96_01420 [Hymenobacter busanensis]QHJ06925.1 hypothetical protein GUY19_06330 [Hymenobacter busanensis]